MTGEASGDMHGALLVRNINAQSAEYEFAGIGGAEMESEGVELLHHYSIFSAMGVVEPLLKLRFYITSIKKLAGYIVENKIKNVILIDIPSFNIPLAQKIKEFDPSVKILYYISPQLWAWHYSRIYKMKRLLHSIVVLYPFETDMYRKEGIRAYFLGNPIVDSVIKKRTRAQI